MRAGRKASSSFRSSGRVCMARASLFVLFCSVLIDFALMKSEESEEKKKKNVDGKLASGIGRASGASA